MSFRKSISWKAAVPVGLLAMAFTAHGTLERWVEDIEAGNRLDGVFFRSYAVANGTSVIGRRPPKETRAELTKLIDQSPSEADLVSLRALEEEKQLDFTAAEADWKKSVELAKDKAAADLSLADYYHRRLMPREEIAALRAAAAATPAASEEALPDSSQKAWIAFERIAGLIDAQALDTAVATEQYQAWVARYPKDSEAYRRACTQLIRRKQFAAAEQLLAGFERQFPDAVEFPTQARAGIELARGSADRALAIYEKSFRPLWSDELAAGYFELLKEEGQLKKFNDRMRAEIAAHPTDLIPATKLYYYFRQQTDSGSASRVLTDFRKRKEAAKSPWTASEDETLAILFGRTNQYDDSARHYHALYVHPNATPAQAEMALAAIVDLLLTAAEQPIEIGAGELSYYRDIATMDRSPGYLNGVLSLLLNDQNPAASYQKQNEQALSYFHRVKAAQLDQLFERKYPKSDRRAALRARLIQVYALYGDTQAVIDNGKLFLTAFPKAGERTEVALSMADGYARLGKTSEEFALYRDLLVELAAKANGKPIGAAAPDRRDPQASASDDQQQQPAAGADQNQDRGLRLVNQAASATAKPDAGVGSQDYVRVLDRYLARLVSMKRMTDALRVYRNELERNAADPGLYERFAVFLDQNKLGGEIEKVYRDAMQRFPEDTNWSHKLARWYLREKQAAKYAELTRQVTKIFSGTDLQAYLEMTSGMSNVGVQMYMQVNQYAHQRFPHNLTFVRNLLVAYSTRGTANAVGYEQLLRENWYHAPDLRARFFEMLSRSKRLDAELASLRTMKPNADSNPAAAQMLAEAEVWKTNYEAAAQPFRLLAASYPAEGEIDDRAASLQRSLNRTDAAELIEGNLAKANPRSRDILTRMGEIEADRERYDRAAPSWRKMVLIEPGKSEGYLEAATVFWDYFQFADAMKTIEQARQKLGNPALFAYEAGAIHENQRDYPAALNEYAKGALVEGAGQCRERLLRLGKRKAYAAEVDAITKRIGASQNSANIELRISYLEGQARPADLERYLGETLSASTSPEIITLVESSARQNEMKDLLRRVIERRISMTTDPVELLRVRMELARFYENEHDLPKAAAVIDALYRENPAIAGVIRAAVSYYWRNQQPKRAVDLLVEAGNRSQDPYQDRFRFEAAQKAIESGEYDRGQQLISALLEKEPYRADYLAVSGDLYARRGDDNSLRTYYLNTIDSLKKSPLGADEKISRVAELRRSLIPVLTRLKDFAGATDQYMEVINRYPEDEGLVRETALYAIQNGQLDRLKNFYTKTAATASRDHRWPIVLEEIELQAENYPAALEWLQKARAIRPERTDFLAAKGPIEERLLRFDDAAKTYAMLWELTYHDPSWMVKCAEQYERLGRHDDAIAAIRKAYIDGRPETPDNYLSAATLANEWNLLDASQGFLDKGMATGTKGSSIYNSLEAFQGMLAARRHVALPPLVKDMQVATTRWGEAVAQYSTPEEKAAIERKLDAETGSSLAMAAGFVELLTRWQPVVVDGVANARWIELESLRGKIAEIGPRLEAGSKNGTLKVQQRDALLYQARQYYAQSGDRANELRLLEQSRADDSQDSRFVARYSDLAALDPKQALAIVASDPNQAMRNAVANRLLGHAQASEAFAIVQARGSGLKPVWTKGYTALMGVYYDVRTPLVRAAFQGVLGPQTIGEQLGNQPNADEQAAGANWYYYAARYGEYLTTGNDQAGEDYMLTRLESSPGSAGGYQELADFYEEHGQPKRALLEYDYEQQLDPESPVPHVRKASILAGSGDMAGARAEWKVAIDTFENAFNHGAAATWWTDLASMLYDMGKYKALDPLREDVSRVLRAQFKRNGAYNSEPLVRAIYDAAGDPQAGVQWLADLSGSAPDPNQVLDLALKADWLPEGQRDVLYTREIEYAESKANAAMGDTKVYLRERVVSLQLARIRDLMDHGNVAMAEKALQALPQRVVEANMKELGAIQIRIAAKRGTLVELLAKYKRDAEHAPGADILQAAATDLRGAGDETNANKVLEFMYEREIASRNFTAPNFLGLAEVRLANKDLAGALELLRRMNLMVGAPFQYLGESGSLLWRTGHLKEAADYYDQLVKVRPWDPDQRLDDVLVKLEAGDKGQVTELAAVAKNPAASYATRLRAALAIRKAGGMDGLNSGTGELDLIAGKSPITEAQASKPFYIPARLLAARETKDPAVRFRLLTEALSIAPNAAGHPRSLLFRSAIEMKRWYLANSLFRGTDLESANPLEERIALLRGMIEIKQQTGELAGALDYQEQLLPLLEGSEKAALERAMSTQKVQIERKNDNDGRRPVISESLVPPQIVKQRVKSSNGGVQ